MANAYELGKVSIHNTTKDAFKGSTVHTEDGEFKGAYYLSERPEYYEPQRSNCFKFVVNDLKVDLAAYGIKNTYTDDDLKTSIELSVKASSVPHFDIDKLTINRGNSQMHFAGKPTFKDGQITVHDYIGTHVKDILLAWQHQAYDVDTEKIGLAKDYKRTAKLYELTPDYQIVREWTLYGCWISGLSEGNYDHDSTEARTVDATIIYDYAKPVIWPGASDEK